MRRELLYQYIRDLSASFGGIKPLIPREPLLTYYKRKNYIEMVRYIRSSMNLDIKILFKIVRENDENNPAYLEMPTSIPFFGTFAYTLTKVRLHIRKDFICEAPYESVVVAIAHELSHAVLHSIRHDLHKEEVATDLTAMILGYRNFFLRGSTYHAGSSRNRLGYLTQEEIRYAYDMIETFPLKK
jgi:hypothetical protein